MTFNVKLGVLQQKFCCLNVFCSFFFSRVFNSGVTKKEKCLVQNQQDFLLDLAMVIEYNIYIVIS